MYYFKDKNILDCGCGNERDSIALSNISNVDAVDNCGFLETNIKFYINKSKYDLIYSRFTFHSITNEQHISFVDTINVDSYFAIETRSKNVKMIMFFTEKHIIEIIFIMEDLNFAKYKNENPICKKSAFLMFKGEKQILNFFR